MGQREAGGVGTHAVSLKSDRNAAPRSTTAARLSVGGAASRLAETWRGTHDCDVLFAPRHTQGGRRPTSPRTGPVVMPCDPIFDHAGAAFAALKVPLYVRHTHTGRDGPWWPSTTDPPESWHPLVQATNRSLPNEFLAEAATAGVKVIAYHYMKASNFYAKAQPSWYLDRSVAQRLRDHVAARSGHVRVRARLAGHLHRHRDYL